MILYLVRHGKDDESKAKANKKSPILMDGGLNMSASLYLPRQSPAKYFRH